MTAPGGDLNARLDVVDILRGFALTGLFLVHMVESYELYWHAPDKGWIGDTVYLLFMGKSFSLLALCFGFSFYILMERAARRGVDFTARFAWRLTVLFGIGWVHSLIYRGDIIMLLSAMGFLLLLFHRVKNNRVLIAVALLCLAQPFLILHTVAAANGVGWANISPFHYQDPAMQSYLYGDVDDVIRANLWAGQWPKWWFMVEAGRMSQIMGLYLVGMVLGRIGFFGRLGDFARGRAIGFVVALTVAVTFWWWREDVVQWFNTLGYGEAATRQLRYLLGSWFELAGMSCWALILCALWQWGAGAILRPFAPIGRTTLTLYMLQSAVFVPVFYHFGLGLWDDWDQATRFCVGLAAVVAQMVLATFWLRHFAYGPVEWLWRAATYQTWNVPFRKRVSV